jgi:hypothetical protein
MRALLMEFQLAVALTPYALLFCQVDRWEAPGQAQAPAGHLLPPPCGAQGLRGGGDCGRHQHRWVGDALARPVKLTRTPCSTGSKFDIHMLFK